MKVERRVVVAATPVEAFAKLSDVNTLATLMGGLMEWSPTADPNRFRVVFRMGPAPLVGEVELEFWPEAGTVVWHATKGVQHLGRFLVRKRDGGSEVTLRIFWHLDGGIFSRFAEALSAITIHNRAGDALARLKRSIEATPPRPRRRLRATGSTPG